MKKHINFVALLVILPFLLTGQDRLQLETMARNFLDHFLNKDMDKMEQMLGNQFLDAIPEGQLKEIANGLENQLGAFSHITRVEFTESHPYQVVTLVAKFGPREWGVFLTFDNELKIQGFLINVAPPENFTPPPAYADSTLFTEIAMDLNINDISLPAMLTMPNNRTDLPAVVLVHGSGAHNKDQAVGPNKIFRDIAHGLATYGIAVFRYEKRSLRHHNTLDRENFTAWDETGHDAVEAISMVGSLPGIDPNRIYLAGHSLGGVMAPRIALQAPQLAGIISLAGSPRYLYELIPDQFAYIASFRKDTTQMMSDMIAETLESVDRLTNKRENPNAVYESRLMGLPPSYWRDINQHDVGAIAATLPQRILIIQGGRDYQVTLTDYQAWKKALARHPDATFHLLEDLDHLFFSGQGPSNPDSYFEENNVDRKIIDVIREWLHNK